MKYKNNYQASRRDFIKKTGAFSGLAMAGLPGSQQLFGASSQPKDPMKKITIKDVNASFEREPLAHLFGFKGGFMSEIWQSIAQIESNNGVSKIGLGVQSVLWSDADVFAAHTEAGGNGLMFSILEKALQVAKGQSFTTPVDLLENVLPEALYYGKKITENPHLRETFALNALVAFDFAAWLVYAEEHGITDFDNMVPDAYKQGLSYHHNQVASAPSFSYNIPINEIEQAKQDGYFFMKIKLGQPGTQEEMLEKDKQRLTEIHNTLGGTQTSYSEDGKLPYYLDANGRYESKDTLKRFLDHAEKIGAFDQIVVMEEPFPENYHVNVEDLGVRVAADESAHTDQDVKERIEMGYSAIALKPIAKTLSMTMKMAQTAYENNIPCFCADLTVNPILVDWNKVVAARLKPLPGFDLGVMETNGHQNYEHWEKMESYHPMAGAPWTKVKNGVFELGNEFYEHDGGIFKQPEHYLDFVKYRK